MKRKLNYSEGTQRQVFGEKMALPSRSTIRSSQLSLGVVPLWYGDAFPHRALLSYKLSIVEWMVACAGRFKRRTFRNLQLLWDMVRILCFSTTIIPNIPRNLQRNDLKIMVLVLSIVQVSLLTWIQLRICEILWRLKFISGIHKISSN